MLYRLVITLLPRNKHLLISWLKSPSREGNGTPFQYSCLENPRDGELVGCHLWGHTESDTTEATQQQQRQQQSPSAVILEPKRIKSVTVSIVFPSICHEVMEPDAMILVFWMLSVKLFHSFLSLLLRGSLVPLCFLLLEWYHLHIWGCWYFSLCA